MEEEFWDPSNSFWNSENVEDEPLDVSETQLEEDDVIVKDDFDYSIFDYTEEDDELYKQAEEDDVIDFLPPRNALNDNAKYAFNYLNNKGIPRHVSAGIVGNLMKESNLNPNSRDGDNRGGVGGIAQWDPNRSRNLLNWSRSRNLNPYSLETQLDFVIEESTQRGDLQRASQTSSPEDAAYIFGKYYERPNEKYADWNSRKAYARQVNKGQYGISNIPEITDFELDYNIEPDPIDLEIQPEIEELDISNIEENSNNNGSNFLNLGTKAFDFYKKVEEFKNRLEKQTAQQLNEGINMASSFVTSNRNAQVQREMFNKLKDRRFSPNTNTNNNNPILI